MASDGPSHLLSLKVMRVSRPELASAWQPFYSSSPSFSAHSSSSILSLQGTSPLPGHPKTLRDFTHASELLMLPSSFGSIQLGETFSSCLCVNNETHVDVELVQMRVEMQTVTNKVTLYETDKTTGDMLGGGDTLEHVVHHEIKELGQHVLACTVTYRLPPNARSVPGASEDADDPSLQTFRKFYKFAVTNPLSVKTKVHASKSPSAMLSAGEREKVFLEVHIQNLTQDSICFERMRLECTDEWEAKDANILDDEGASIFSGSMALMHPQDMRQYIYILTPKHVEPVPPLHTPGSVIPLGRLDISWRSSFGEPGRLLTSMLSRRIPLPTAQPASALPPHLKRFGSIVDNQSRPRSPSLNQSRPGTPPLGHRPASPSTNKPLPPTSNTTLPHSPSVTMLASRLTLPDLEASLVVVDIPRDNIQIEKPFKISFSLTLSAICGPALPQHRRRLFLAVQHISPQKPVQAPVASVAPEVSSPRVPSSGFSTPGSSTGTFNYALAHQKILAASTVDRGPNSLAIESSSDESGPILPLPFYDSTVDTKNVRPKVMAVGPSAIFLPPLEMDFINEKNEPKVYSTTSLDLSFIALHHGFASVGGLRLLLVGEEIILPGNEGPRPEDVVKKVQTLKEYEVIAEIMIPA
ncbi:hypothetical protein CVT24_005714 [Panaeolus cyanescens]|uniref:DUF974-domain-containing protein n=1 Tax=Panaeolus cyanescens TaxID=181874 RepID=A0A409VB88_9AGAR|nr:hypothetical protein CVT24_005714 [Panaeolus cyanescens]